MAEITLRFDELIDIPPIKLVAQLSDCDHNPSDTISSFIVTDDIAQVLTAILHKIEHLQGCGIFLKGNFGSGKSHLLSYLSLLFSSDTKNLHNFPVLNAFPKTLQNTFLIKKVSLVNFPASASLENILFPEQVATDSNREQLYPTLLPGNCILIIDELSEFLRSKSPPSFYEDVRYLQFLGEFAMNHPLWVIASLQEWIEETGHISSALFNRIKDRFPLRFSLSSDHIEDIIDQRVIIKKAGSQPHIEKIYHDIRQYFPHLPIDYDQFQKTFPLHPFTVRLLHGLTPIFSSARGMIQFIHKQANNILHLPSDELITPTAIFDHFSERIRELPDYSPYVRVVYDYYQKAISEIFDNENHQQIALSVIKLLIIIEINSLERARNAHEIAELLLAKISTLSERINYDFIDSGILSKIVNHKMYITVENGRFFVKPDLNQGLRIKSKIKAAREKYADNDFFFQQIAANIFPKYLPLRDLGEGKRIHFRWQNSSRECIALLANPARLKKSAIDTMLEGLTKKFDCYLLLLPSFHQDLGWIQSLSHNFNHPLLPLLGFWVPQKLASQQLIFCEEYLAKNELEAQYPQLRESIKKDEITFREIVTGSFFQGQIIFGDGQVFNDLESMDFLSFDILIGQVFAKVLDRCYPLHRQIMPRLEIYSRRQLRQVFKEFIRKGKIDKDFAQEKNLVEIISGLLEPMNVVSKKNRLYLIDIPDDNTLVNMFNEFLDHEYDIYSLRLSMLKSQWGLSAIQFSLLVCCLVSSGHVNCFHGDFMVDLNEFDEIENGHIDRIKPGRTLPAGLLAAIELGFFIWGDIENSPTPITQKKMWKSLQIFLKEKKRFIKEIKDLIEQYQGFALWKAFLQADSWDEALLNRLHIFVNSFSSQYSPTQAIEHTLRYLQENSLVHEQFQYLDNIYLFISKHFQTINRYYLYLSSAELNLSPNSKLYQEKAVTQIHQYLINLSEEQMQSLQDSWEEFFADYSDCYLDGHEKYYQHEIFILPEKIRKEPAYITLERITKRVSNITFSQDWWHIQQTMETLPKKCIAQSRQEIYYKPICPCGYKIGMTQSGEHIPDLVMQCQDGIMSFIREIQKPHNRQILQAYGHTDTEVRTLFERILAPRLLKVKLEKSLELFTDNLLRHIDKALQGQWELRRLNIKDFLEKIRGRRLQYGQLQDIFQQWIGANKETIFWLEDAEDAEQIEFRESMRKYGYDPSALSETSKFDVQLNLRGYEDAKLLSFLAKEEILNIRGQIYQEIYDRREHIDLSSVDKVMPAIPAIFISCIHLLQMAKRVIKLEPRIAQFLAPLHNAVHSLTHKNDISGQDEIPANILTQIHLDYLLLEKTQNQELFRQLRRNKSLGDDFWNSSAVCDFLANTMGNTVIFDSMRFDLWLMIKENLIKHGALVTNERLFSLEHASTTDAFRQFYQIGEKQGLFQGSKYSYLRWVDKNDNRNQLNEILTDESNMHRFFHFNFIDSKIHSCIIDPYPLYEIICLELEKSILPILKKIARFTIMADHGFREKSDIKKRYVHGGKTCWESLLPLAQVNFA